MKNKSKKVWLCGLVILTAAVFAAAFQIVRLSGRNRLAGKAESVRPDLSFVKTEAASLTETEEARWQEGWTQYDGKIYAYNEDILTFLVMGIDKDGDVKEVAEGTDGGQADALFLAVLNPHDKTIKIIGINRNTMTAIDLYNEEGTYINTVEAQIAVQHGFGNGVEESCEYQKRAVQRLFYYLPIHGYAAVNMSAVPAINDAVGGVDVTVMEDLTEIDSALVKDTDIHLMGQSAFWYVKYRDTGKFASADGRLARQKQYLNAFIRKAKETVKSDITTVFDLYRAVAPQMVTDITIDEAAYLAPIITDYQYGSDNFYMVEGKTIEGEQFEEFYADEDALYELIIEVFYEEVGEVEE